MPTGARLVSAIFYGFLAYVGAQIVHAIYEAEIGYDLDWWFFAEITAVVGILVGWKFAGTKVGDGYYLGMQNGLISTLILVFYAVLLWAIVEMVQESMKLKYPGATAAVVDIFRIAIEYVKSIAKPTFLITMAIGGLIGGYLAEWSSRRYN